jgi:hypothetical protein
LHHADIDWENFYEKHIPRSCLPSDYGGGLESVEELSKKNLQILKSMKEYFLAEEESIFDEQCGEKKENVECNEFD